MAFICLPLSCNHFSILEKQPSSDRSGITANILIASSRRREYTVLTGEVTMKRFAKFTAALLTAATIFSGTAFALPPVEKNTIRGIDVSVYQGDIDFSAVKKSGIGAVYIRAGAGNTYTDGKLEDNYHKARVAGLKIGFYYYVTAMNEEEAVSQAEKFAALIKGKNYEMRPAMDYESFSGLGRETVNNIGIAFLKETERLTGVRPTVYSDSYRTRNLWDARFGKYPLWVADYDGGENPPDSPIWRAWAGFQYSDRGRIDGIADYVDLNYFTAEIMLSGKTPERPEKGVYYTVKRGDTLWGIARKTGSTVEKIVAANNIKNPDLIYAGEVFLIPEITNTGRYYTVRAGDTLWGIAQRFGSSVNAIAAANGIKNHNLIYAGEVFLIP